MKYFLLNSDPIYDTMPYIMTLPKLFDVKDIMIGKSQNLPDVSIAKIHENINTLFIDIVSSPFLLLSKKCMKVITMYEPNIISKQVVLLDSKNKKMQTYHLPILPKIQCLTRNSRFNLDKSLIEYGELDLDKIGSHSIFHIADVKNRYTIIRLDILESMLKRGARGFSITEIDVT